ncbi:hypothetical protein IAU60_002560 [Kwoniella sp. DSM 27419]
MLPITLVSLFALCTGSALAHTGTPTRERASGGDVRSSMQRKSSVFKQTTRYEIISRASRDRNAARAITSAKAMTCSASYDPTGIVFATYADSSYQSTNEGDEISGTSQEDCDVKCQNMSAADCDVTLFVPGDQLCVYTGSLQFVTAPFGSTGYTVGVRGYTCEEANAMYTPSGSSPRACTNVYCK